MTRNIFRKNVNSVTCINVKFSVFNICNSDNFVFSACNIIIAFKGEYVERGCPASEIVSKYHISSAVVLYGWLDRYLNQKVGVSLQPETDIGTDMAKKTKQQLEEALKAAQAENKRLQEALELEKLRSRAYDTMIDLAEKSFNIPIRKKRGTKQ